MRVEKIIWETFLPRIFFKNTKTLAPIVEALSTMPVNKAVLRLLNPMMSVQDKYIRFQWGSSELIQAVTGGKAFSNADHLRTLGEESHDVKKDWRAAYETKLKGLFRNLKVTDRRLILCAKITDSWLIVRGTTVSGTVLDATEFWDFLCARYNVSPLNLQSHYDGCGIVFRLMHALTCSTGILFIAHHNKIRDKLLYLYRRAFTSASVRAKPLIHKGHTISEQEIRQGSNNNK